MTTHDTDRSDTPTPGPGGKRRERIIALALLCASTLFALLAAEVGVRFLYRDVSTTTGDPVSWWARRWRQANPIERNALGYREDEIAEKEPGVFRIVVIGDSFTQGQGIPVEDRLTELLEVRLDRELPGRFEVLNFGRSGAASDDHLVMLREHALGVSPDFVLLQWFVNDVEALDEAPAGGYLRLVPSDRVTGWLRRHSALFYFANRAWRKLQVGLGWVESYDEYVARVFADPEGEPWRRVEVRLREFAATVEARTIPMGIVLYPSLTDVDGDPARYPNGFVIDHVLGFCARADLRCVDLRETFAAVHPASSMWASRLDSHPGRAANLLATDAVLDVFGAVWSRSARGDDPASASADPGR